MFNYGENSSAFSNKNCRSRTSSSNFFSPLSPISPSIGMSIPAALEGIAGMYNYNIDLTMTSPTTTVTATTATTSLPNYHHLPGEGTTTSFSQLEQLIHGDDEDEQTEIVFDSGTMSTAEEIRDQPSKNNSSKAIEPMMLPAAAKRGFTLPKLRGGKRSTARFLSSLRSSSTVESSVKTYVGKDNHHHHHFQKQQQRRRQQRYDDNGLKAVVTGETMESESLSSKIPYVSRGRRHYNLPRPLDERSTSTRQSLQERLARYRRNNNSNNSRSGVGLALDDPGGAEADDSTASSGLPFFNRPHQVTFSSDSSWNVDDEIRLRQLTQSLESSPSTVQLEDDLEGRINDKETKDGGIPAIRIRRTPDTIRERSNRILNDVFSDITAEESTVETAEGVDGRYTGSNTIQSRFAKIRNNKYYPPSPLRNKPNVPRFPSRRDRTPTSGGGKDHHIITRPLSDEEGSNSAKQWQQPQQDEKTNTGRGAIHTKTNWNSSSPDLSHLISDRLHHLSRLYNQRKKINDEAARRRPGSAATTTEVAGDNDTTASGTSANGVSRKVHVEEANDVVEVIRVPSVATHFPNLPTSEDDDGATANDEARDEVSTRNPLASPTSARDERSSETLPPSTDGASTGKIKANVSLASSSGLHSPPTIVRQLPDMASHNGEGPRAIAGTTVAKGKRGRNLSIFEPVGEDKGRESSLLQKQKAFALGASRGSSAFVPVASASVGLEESRSPSGKEIQPLNFPFNLVSSATSNTDHVASKHSRGLSPPQQVRQQPKEKKHEEPATRSHRHHLPAIDPNKEEKSLHYYPLSRSLADLQSTQVDPEGTPREDPPIREQILHNIRRDIEQLTVTTTQDQTLPSIEETASSHEDEVTSVHPSRHHHEAARRHGNEPPSEHEQRDMAQHNVHQETMRNYNNEPISHPKTRLTQNEHHPRPSPPTHDIESRSIAEEVSETETQDKSVEGWFSKEGDHPIVVEKESKHELQKLRDTLRKILKIEPRIRREIELDELLQGDLHTEEELTQVLSGLAEENSAKAYAVDGYCNLGDPDGALAAHIGASIQRIRAAKRGKRDPEEQRFRKFGGYDRRQEPEGETTIPTTNQILQTLESMSVSLLSGQRDDKSKGTTTSDQQAKELSPQHHDRLPPIGRHHSTDLARSTYQEADKPRATLNDFFTSVSGQGSSSNRYLSEGSSQSRPIVVPEDTRDLPEHDGHMDLFHSVGGVYTAARHRAAIGPDGHLGYGPSYDRRLRNSYLHNDQHQEEIMFVDETEDGVICEALGTRELRDDSLYQQRDYHCTEPRGGTYYRRGNPKKINNEIWTSTNDWKHQMSHPAATGDCSLHIYHMRDTSTRERPISQDFVHQMYGFKVDNNNPSSVLSTGTGPSMVTPGESIPSVIFATKERQGKANQGSPPEYKQSKNDHGRGPRDNAERRNPISSEREVNEQRADGSPQPEGGTPVLDQNDKFEMEKAILDLKTKQISSSTYKKIMMGLRQVRIVDSPEVGGDDSIDNMFFTKEQVSSKEFDKVVQALSEAQVIATTEQKMDQNHKRQKGILSSKAPDPDTEVVNDPPEIDRSGTIDSMICIKGIRVKSKQKPQKFSPQSQGSSNQGGMRTGEKVKKPGTENLLRGKASSLMTGKQVEVEQVSQRTPADPSQCGSMDSQRDNLGFHNEAPPTPSSACREGRLAFTNQRTPKKATRSTDTPNKPNTRTTRDPPTRPEMVIPGLNALSQAMKSKKDSTDPPLRRQKQSADPPPQLTKSSGCNFQNGDSPISPMARKARAAIDRKRKNNKTTTSTALPPTFSLSPIRDSVESKIAMALGSRRVERIHGTAQTDFPVRDSLVKDKIAMALGSRREERTHETIQTKLQSWRDDTSDPSTHEKSMLRNGQVGVSTKTEPMVQVQSAEYHEEALSEGDFSQWSSEGIDALSSREDKGNYADIEHKWRAWKSYDASTKKEGKESPWMTKPVGVLQTGEEKDKHVDLIEQKRRARKVHDDSDLEEQDDAHKPHKGESSGTGGWQSKKEQVPSQRKDEVSSVFQKEDDSVERKAEFEVSQITRSLEAMRGLGLSPTSSTTRSPKAAANEKIQQNEAPPTSPTPSTPSTTASRYSTLREKLRSREGPRPKLFDLQPRMNDATARAMSPKVQTHDKGSSTPAFNSNSWNEKVRGETTKGSTQGGSFQLRQTDDDESKLSDKSSCTSQRDSLSMNESNLFPASAPSAPSTAAADQVCNDRNVRSHVDDRGVKQQPSIETVKQADKLKHAREEEKYKIHQIHIMSSPKVAEDLKCSEEEPRSSNEQMHIKKMLKASENLKRKEEEARYNHEQKNSPKKLKGAVTASDRDTSKTRGDESQPDKPTKCGREGCPRERSEANESFWKRDKVGANAATPEIFRRAIQRTNQLLRNFSPPPDTISKESTLLGDTTTLGTTTLATTSQSVSYETTNLSSQELSKTSTSDTSSHGSCDDSNNSKPANSTTDDDAGSAPTTEELNTALYDDGTEEVIPWTGSDGVEIILSYNSSVGSVGGESEAEAGAASLPRAKKDETENVSTLRQDTNKSGMSLNQSTLAKSTDQLVGMVLQVRQDDKSTGNDEPTTPGNKHDAAFVSPFDFAEFPRDSQKLMIDKLGLSRSRMKAPSTEGSFSLKSMPNKACSETTDSVRNVEIGNSFQSSLNEEQRPTRGAIAHSNCQAKVDLFKRRLEAASKFSIVGKDIVQRKTNELDRRSRRSILEASPLPRHPGNSNHGTRLTTRQRSSSNKESQSKLLANNTGESVCSGQNMKESQSSDSRKKMGEHPLPQTQRRLVASLALEQRPSTQEELSSHDGTTDSSELVGDQYVDNDLNKGRIHRKIEVAREDIDTVRSRLQRKKKSAKAASERASKQQGTFGVQKPPDNLVLMRTKKQGILETDTFSTEVDEMQTDDSYSLPTCFQPKRNDSDYLTSRRILSHDAHHKANARMRKGGHDSLPNQKSNDSSVQRRAVARQSSTDHVKQETIVRAAERAEKRVREGLEKMKKGLADNKKAKLSVEKHRKKQASDSPKSRKASTSMFGGLGIFSWLNE